MTANPGELLRAALRYAELGYPVFPCAPGTKKPLTQHGFHDASADADQIEAWWAQHPAANIGIPTAGMIVIDIDGEGNPWMADAPERMLDLATGPMALTPRGGSHRIFRQPPSKAWRCTESRLAPRVDTRADGGYIVAPPSFVTGKGQYVWAPGLELDTARDSLPQPPGWLVEDLDRLETTPKDPTNGSPTLAHVAAVGDEANAIPEGQRNATLARLAGGMRRFGMSRSEIAAAILRANEERCVPPLAPAEVERIAASIARYEPDGVARAVAENHFDQMYVEATDGDDPSLDDPGPIPDEMLRVPGFVSDVMKYTLETAPYPEPVLAFAGALTLQALLAGRKVADPMDNRTNLYVLGLANSGVGKDHARKVNARILYEVGLANCLGTSFASGEGIEDRLSAEPATLFQVDEIDGLLLRVSQAKDARHEAIVSMLLQMYSSASSVYVMRAKAGRDRSVINQPHLCLFGTAVPQHFYEALTARQMTNGFLARLLVIECRKRGEGQEANQRAVPNNILEAARWWADLRPGGNLHAEHPTPRIVPADDEAVSATAANSPEVRRILRNRARYEVANNSYARGIVLTLANDVVGTGPRLQMLTPDADANRRIEILFEAWSQAIHLASKLRTLRMARASDGEGFGVLTSNPRLATPVQLDLRLIEADRVTSPDGNARGVDGIVLDPVGNPVEYHVLKRHPGDTTFQTSLDYDRIPAESVVHWFRMDRAGQARGIPDITPALPLFAQLRRYTLAVLAAAETAADFAAFLKTDAPAGGESDAAEPFETLEIEQRMLTTLPAGWDVNQLRAEQPTTSFAEFKHEILNEIARCLNMPFCVAAGNSSGYNYASGRLDHQTYFKSIRVEQVDLEEVVLDRLLAAWLDEASLIPGLLPTNLGPFADWPHQWFWDGQEHVDPAKEASAQATRLVNHTTTLADEYARRGQDWETQLRQRAKEVSLMNELGLMPAQAQPRTPEEEPDDADEPAAERAA